MEELNSHLISIGVGCNRTKDAFHLYAIGKNNKKIFFTGDGFSEDINEKVETDDWSFAMSTMIEMVSDDGDRNAIIEALKGEDE